MRIDREMEERKSVERERKVLVLGASYLVAISSVNRHRSPNSGTSTLLRQLRIVHQHGLPLDTRISFRPIVWGHLLESVHAVLHGLRHLEMKFKRAISLSHRDTVLNYKYLSNDPSSALDSRIATAIYELWQDEVMPSLMEYSANFYLPENATYFLDAALRICLPDYVPTDEDVLHTHTRCNGVSEERLEFDTFSLRLINVRSQSLDRLKWMHTFDPADLYCLVLCVGTVDYDRIPAGDTLSPLDRYLALVSELFSLTSPLVLRDIPVLFLFTKSDVLSAKLSRAPLNEHVSSFPPGADPLDVAAAAKYIVRSTMEARGSAVRVASRPLLMNLTDTLDTRALTILAQAVGHPH
ncbi:hypothetical protein FA95DRAFT_1679881 [Auriscalpium vulgare]|uniref:Uncharacterized protein n=1 Tax=Auriscalpium vulgare TaxID=40419 RepID=A0ACB8RQV2_9AGAM|nr:hypothetical protein FA95DRAFT_1679881 [Auriscalpium vulgare]